MQQGLTIRMGNTGQMHEVDSIVDYREIQKKSKPSQINFK